MEVASSIMDEATFSQTQATLRTVAGLVSGLDLVAYLCKLERGHSRISPLADGPMCIANSKSDIDLYRLAMSARKFQQELCSDEPDRSGVRALSTSNGALVAPVLPDADRGVPVAE